LRGTIEEMRKIARDRGGECLSDEYFGRHTHLTWRCSEGHEWRAKPGNIKQGAWCQECYNARRGNSQRLTIEDMRKVAEDKGGKCLSNTYINNRTKLQWQCSVGHTFTMAYDHVNRPQWCPICAGRQITIKNAQEIAAAKGGECLSTEYINNRTQLIWRCSQKHTWAADFSSIQQGRWCPFCAGRHRTIETMQNWAKEKGGKCISEKYNGMNSRLEWECELGHRWMQRPSNILRNHWCPICSTGVSERICREVLERIFNNTFPPSRPKWLVNPKTNKLLQLDGYCHELKIAFEYQGSQHYNLDTQYIRKQSALNERQELDTIKLEKCGERGIHLLVIPYYVHNGGYHQLIEFIIKQVKLIDNAPTQIPLDVYDIKTFDVYSPKYLKELQLIAQARGGTCLSDNYISATTKMQWRCKSGHNWETTPQMIKAGHWCHVCGRSQRKTIEDMNKIAKLKGGLCLSSNYVNGRTKLQWQCESNHIWWATPSDIKRGTWCPTCSRKRIGNHSRGTIEEMKKIAKERGGECLSEIYQNNTTLLKWRCENGHEWEAYPRDIKRGNWCKECRKIKKSKVNRKYYLDNMKKIAKERGGECLSLSFDNVKQKLLWRCSDGHIWETSHTSIIKGTWCPICSAKNAGEEKRKYDIRDMQKIAKSHGGKCLSNIFTNIQTKLKWRCSEGHEWEAIPNAILRGHWCKKCSSIKAGEKHRKYTIEDMHDIAVRHGGLCLSNVFTTVDVKLRWQCAKGHEWEAIPYTIIKGGWCPFCAKDSFHHRVFTIDDLKQYAISRGGLCISDTYINTKSKVKWECHNHHIWESSWEYIKNDHWCPICARKQKLKP